MPLNFSIIVGDIEVSTIMSQNRTNGKSLYSCLEIECKDNKLFPNCNTVGPNLMGNSLIY